MRRGINRRAFLTLLGAAIAAAVPSGPAAAGVMDAGALNGLAISGVDMGGGRDYTTWSLLAIWPDGRKELATVSTKPVPHEVSVIMGGGRWGLEGRHESGEEWFGILSMPGSPVIVDVDFDGPRPRVFGGSYTGDGRRRRRVRWPPGKGRQAHGQ